jgi:hypothetical protein
VALFSAICIAMIGAVMWCFLSWRGLASQRNAVLLGLGLCTTAAWCLFSRVTVEFTLIMLIGLLGGFAGYATYAIDSLLSKALSDRS